jgi:hypothetical protein
MLTSDLVTPSVEQLINFLVKEKVKLAEILHRLNVQYGEETLSCVHVSVTGTLCPLKAVKKVLNIAHVHIQPMAVYNSLH